MLCPAGSLCATDWFFLYDPRRADQCIASYWNMEMLRLQLRPVPLGVSRHVARASASRAAPACSLQDLNPPASGASASRRESMAGLLALTGGLLLAGQATAAGSIPKTSVGAYLPKDEAIGEGFVRYTPDTKKTPAIRAGVIKPNPDFYSFALPETWSEGLISNTLSGNFCMPRCDEPWVEAIFSDEKEGSCQLVVSPLFRLVSKANAQLKDVGPPEGVVESVGNFITGNYLDEDDVLSATTAQLADGREAYFYEIYAPYAKTGSHCLAAFTVKGDAAYLFVVSATDKQWAQSESKLRTMLKSLKA